jgi:hypothetical protein
MTYLKFHGVSYLSELFLHPAIGATKKMLELFIEGANNKASSDPS